MRTISKTKQTEKARQVRASRKTKAFYLFSQGKTSKEIAQLVGVTPQTLVKWKKQYERTTNKQSNRLTELLPLLIDKVETRLNQSPETNELYQLTKTFKDLYQITNELTRHTKKQNQIYFALDLLNKGNTIKQTAELMGLHHSTISKWKQKYKAPDLNKTANILLEKCNNILSNKDLSISDIETLTKIVYMLKIVLKKSTMPVIINQKQGK